MKFAGASFGGFGARHPQATMTFDVFKKGQDKSVWFEGSLEGEKTADNVGATPVFDGAKLHELVIQSTKTAIVKIGAAEK